jgi:hypothetical protein
MQSCSLPPNAAGMSMKIKGVRPSRRTTSTCMPGIVWAFAQPSISLTASSM